MPPPSLRKAEATAKKVRGKRRSENLAKSRVTKPSFELPFWKRKALEELTPAEWESLCDGCGRCCLVKLEDEDTGKVHFTDIACRLFDPASCRCTDYAHRHRKVRDCIQLTPAKVRELQWLPPSCAYRLIAKGRNLPWWHPLISGSQTSVHKAGISVRSRVVLSERELPLAEYPDHIVAWPGKRPRAPRPKTASLAQGPGHARD